MRTLSVFALLTAGLLVVPAAADEKDKKEEKALTGSFTRKAGEFDFKMEFKKDKVLVFHVTTGDVGCVMTSKYALEKDGVFKCEVTEFEKKGDFPVSKDKGYKFSFKLKIEDKKVTLSDLEGDDINPDQKEVVEGDYEKVND
jgi:hypothetical protein